MPLILEPTRVLLQSDDTLWYWTGMTLAEGVATLSTDTTPVTPPSGATGYALLRLGSSFYRWTLSAVEGLQLSVFTLSAADGSERDSISLLLGSTTYTLALALVEGVPVMTITTVVPPPPPPPPPAGNIASLSIIPFSVPLGTCYPATVQGLINLVARSTVQFTASSFTVIVTGDTTPPATDRDKLWARPDFAGLFHYDTALSHWVAAHPTPPSGDERRLWVGDLATLEEYDGGDTDDADVASGPMWEVDPAFAARVPLGVGTLPLSGTAVGVLATGGLDQVTLTQAQLPAVKLAVDTAIIGRIGNVGANGNEPVVGNTYGTTPIATTGSAVDATDETGGFADRYFTRGQTVDMGTGAALATMPPYVGVYFIRRTTRIWIKS